MKSEALQNLDGDEDLKIVEKKPKRERRKKPVELEEDALSVSEALKIADLSNLQPESEPVDEGVEDNSEGFKSLPNNFEGLEKVFNEGTSKKEEEVPAVENKADQLQAEIAAARQRLENVPAQPVVKKESPKTSVYTEKFAVEEEEKIEKMFDNVKREEMEKLKKIKKEEALKKNLESPSFWERFVKFLTPEAEAKNQDPYWGKMKFWRARTNRKEEMKQFKDRGRNDRDRDRFEDEPERE